jgi:hypothetical protein
MSEPARGQEDAEPGPLSLFANDVRLAVRCLALDHRLFVTALVLAMFERVWYAVGVSIGAP